MSEVRLYQQLGKAIAKRRNDLGLKQHEVAKEIGLARASLANVENGRQRILVHQLFLLIRALKLNSITELVPPTWQFENDEDAPRIQMRLNAKANDSDAATTLTDAQQAVVQNVVRFALAGSRGKKSK